MSIYILFREYSLMDLLICFKNNYTFQLLFTVLEMQQKSDLKSICPHKDYV